MSNSQAVCLHTTLVYKSSAASGAEERAGGNWGRGDFEIWRSNYCTVVGINFLACCVFSVDQNKPGPCSLEKLHKNYSLSFMIHPSFFPEPQFGNDVVSVCHVVSYQCRNLLRGQVGCFG